MSETTPRVDFGTSMEIQSNNGWLKKKSTIGNSVNYFVVVHGNF